MLPQLCYVAHALPGADSKERGELARELGIGLEVAYKTGRRELAADLALYQELGVPVTTLQAWKLHEHHFLSPSESAREAALGHVLDTIQLAAEHGVPRVLVVCGFGEEHCERPFASCRDGLAAALSTARAVRVQLLVELLSPQRSTAMSEPAELARLLSVLDAPRGLASAIDTGHLLDAGLEPPEFLAQWPHHVEELQLRGADSSAPTESIDLSRLLAARSAPPRVVCVEHRHPLPEEELCGLLQRLRSQLGDQSWQLAHQ